MTIFSNSRAITAFSLLIAASLFLSACFTKPDRIGPPPDRQGGGAGGGQGKSSGTFLQPIAAVFTDMDTNRDKVTTRSEMQAGAAAQWAGFDRNPSGATFASWSVTNLGSIDAMPTFMSFDKDFNGVITETEFLQQFDKDFRRLDKNDDGRLERSEMLIAFTAPRGQQSRQGESRPERGQRGGGGGRPPR